MLHKLLVGLECGAFGATPGHKGDGFVGVSAFVATIGQELELVEAALRHLYVAYGKVGGVAQGVVLAAVGHVGAR